MHLTSASLELFAPAAADADTAGAGLAAEARGGGVVGAGRSLMRVDAREESVAIQPDTDEDFILCSAAGSLRFDARALGDARDEHEDEDEDEDERAAGEVEQLRDVVRLMREWAAG
eukprot:3849849-Rhodomonas_salina.1